MAGSLLAVFILIFSTTAAINADQDNIVRFLPEASEFQGWKWSGEPRQFELMQLFAVINGEAERYMRHGCLRAAFATYRTPDGLFVDVQVFKMKDGNSAKGVFDEKSDKSGERLSLGDEAIFEGYYLNLRTGDYLVTVSGSDPEQTTRNDIIPVARSISKKIGRN